eukprot:CAMPEP_0204215956 /NCGR_PEP_ID=MMETSP0361-20130328/77812_1 /ASSEMBLY_ACC=CAM_ASM_000343 /TAXON_ID=268821 /ORGANISM="Scrippsiella Hangoei, Strain SHTV-5" /LENGTH=71 /DNA_ID=CAMNT_0051180747 /DNA_START=78 /DNA_END=291 /DNA_ORIENTATION=-
MSPTSPVWSRLAARMLSSSIACGSFHEQRHMRALSGWPSLARRMITEASMITFVPARDEIGRRSAETLNWN